MGHGPATAALSQLEKQILTESKGLGASISPLYTLLRKVRPPS
jgi:hypothetical protein